MPQRAKLITISGIVLVLLAGSWLQSQFSAPQRQAGIEQFIVPLRASQAEILQSIKEQGFVKNLWALALAYKLTGAKPTFHIEPGGYALAKSMDAWQIVAAFDKEPNALWVVIPEGVRKEQIADVLGKTFTWSDAQKENWISNDTTQKPEYREGVYFPETYLIGKNETGGEIAQKFINKFNEKFEPYAQQFLQKNIKWDTALTIASLIQREAGGKEDMPIIAGVIWNRLAQHMRLEIDATLQYAKGKAENGWWGPVTRTDKQIDSPYNTYKIDGLPPHPIANPGLNAIDAALNPAKTQCLYYLHDKQKQIHCAKTFEEHKQNIEKYLK